MTGTREITQGLGWPALTGSPTTDLGWPDEDRVSRETTRLQVTEKHACPGRTDGPPARSGPSGESRPQAAGAVAQVPRVVAPAPGGANAVLGGNNGDTAVSVAVEEQWEQPKEAAVQTVVPAAAPEEDVAEVNVPDGTAPRDLRAEGRRAWFPGRRGAGHTRRRCLAQHAATVAGSARWRDATRCDRHAGSRHRDSAGCRRHARTRGRDLCARRHHDPDGRACSSRGRCCGGQEALPRRFT